MKFGAARSGSSIGGPSRSPRDGYFGAPSMIFFSSSKTPFGVGADRVYCAIDHVLPSKTSTPLPRLGPRFGVARSSSNHATRPSFEKLILRRTERKLHAFPFAKCGCA